MFCIRQRTHHVWTRRAIVYARSSRYHSRAETRAGNSCEPLHMSSRYFILNTIVASAEKCKMRSLQTINDCHPARLTVSSVQQTHECIGYRLKRIFCANSEWTVTGNGTSNHFILRLLIGDDCFFNNVRIRIHFALTLSAEYNLIRFAWQSRDLRVQIISRIWLNWLYLKFGVVYFQTIYCVLISH